MPRKPPINVTAQPQVPTTYNLPQPLATAQPTVTQLPQPALPPAQQQPPAQVVTTDPVAGSI